MNLTDTKEIEEGIKRAEFVKKGLSFPVSFDR
jgi:hypothetical protein